MGISDIVGRHAFDGKGREIEDRPVPDAQRRSGLEVALETAAQRVGAFDALLLAGKVGGPRERVIIGLVDDGGTQSSEGGDGRKGACGGNGRQCPSRHQERRDGKGAAPRTRICGSNRHGTAPRLYGSTRADRRGLWLTSCQLPVPGTARSRRPSTATILTQAPWGRSGPVTSQRVSSILTLPRPLMMASSSTYDLPTAS